MSSISYVKLFSLSKSNVDGMLGVRESIWARWLPEDAGESDEDSGSIPNEWMALLDACIVSDRIVMLSSILIGLNESSIVRMLPRLETRMCFFFCGIWIVLLWKRDTSNDWELFFRDCSSTEWLLIVNEVVEILRFSTPNDIYKRWNDDVLLYTNLKPIRFSVMYFVKVLYNLQSRARARILLGAFCDLFCFSTTLWCFPFDRLK